MDFKNILRELNNHQYLLSLPIELGSLGAYFSNCIPDDSGMIHSAVNGLLKDTDTLYLYKIGEHNIGDIFNLKDSPKHIYNLGDGKWISILYFSKQDNKMYIVPMCDIYYRTFIEQIGNINPTFIEDCKDYNSMTTELMEYLIESIEDPVEMFKEIIRFKINYSKFVIEEDSSIYKYIMQNINHNHRIIQYLFNHPHLLSQIPNFLTEKTWKCIQNGRDYLR